MFSGWYLAFGSKDPRQLTDRPYLYEHLMKLEKFDEKEETVFMESQNKNEIERLKFQLFDARNDLENITANSRLSKEEKAMKESLLGLIESVTREINNLL
jgi:hypothetical protein